MKYKKSFALLEKINIGWNIGNYLDAHDKQYFFGKSTPKTIKEVVNLWNNPVLNLDCFKNLKKLGFNCIRLPVTFCNFIKIDNGIISITNELFNHLKKIIDFAISQDFYIILDLHHDDQTWLYISCNKKLFKKVCKQYFSIWQIIAKEFKDYDNHLIFEGMNEVIDRSNPNKFDWIGKKKYLFKNLNKLYKIFIKAVRNFSKNNLERTLIIPTYGAQLHYNAVKNFKIPKDNNLIVDIHFYSKQSEIEYFKNQFKFVDTFFIKKHIPVIIGECGIKKDYISDFSILSTYLNFTKQNNYKCILWDNGSSRKIIDRNSGKVTYTELIKYLNNY